MIFDIYIIFVTKLKEVIIMTDFQMRRYWFELANYIQTGERGEFLGSVLRQMDDIRLEQTAMICSRARTHFGKRMFTGFELESFAKEIMSPRRQTKRVREGVYHNQFQMHQRMAQDASDQAMRAHQAMVENAMEMARQSAQRAMDSHMQMMQLHMQMHNNMNGF